MFYNFLKKINREAFNNSIFIIGLILIIALGIFIRTKLLVLNPSFWFDTCALGVNIEKSFFELLKPLDITQVAPVFFMWISKVFYSIVYNGSDLALKDLSLRLFPYICGILSLFAFPFLVWKMFKNWYLTLVSLFMLSVNMKAVYYSIEFKQYGLEMLVSIVLMYIFYDLDLKKDSKYKFWIYSIITAICIWFSNSSLFILPVGIAILLFNAVKENKIKNFCNFFMPFAVSFILFIFCFYIPVHNSMYVDMKNHWLNADPSFFTVGNFIEKFSDKINTLIQLPFNISVFFFMLINIVIMLLNKNYKAFFLIIIPFFVVIVFSFMNLYPFQTRLILFLLPMLIILYCQIILMIKENMVYSVIILLLLVRFSYTALNMPVENYMVNISSARELFCAIKLDNPELKNIISTENSVILKYYGGIKSMEDEVSWIDFKTESKLPAFIDSLDKGIYYIYSPFNMYNYCKDLEEYLNNSKKIKVIKKWEGIDTSFSAKIERV